MLIPSIDIMNGRAVQLVNGRRFELDGGDPLDRAAEFSLLGEIAVVDLDAALGKGDNRALVLELIKKYPCRVGGGIRDAALATEYLDAGAVSIMIGTMATPSFLKIFPASRLIACLDSRNGIVMDSGWTKSTGASVSTKCLELADYAGGFLFTEIGREGTLEGADISSARLLKNALRESGYKGNITLAGGVVSSEEMAELDSLGIDAQVGMALYKGILKPAQALSACLHSDRADGLWPTVVCDEAGVALGLAYSDAESLATAIETRTGIYRSRKRGLWKKGGSSGDTQTLLRVDADCDRDALRFTVRLDSGKFCHSGARSCFTGPQRPDGGFGLLDRTVAGRLAMVSDGTAPVGSYTARLFGDPALLGSKLSEEARELCEAQGAERAAEEAADLLYFAAVKLAREGSSLAEAAKVLDRRALRLSRRPGDAKKNITAEGAGSWAQGIH